MVTCFANQPSCPPRAERKNSLRIMRSTHQGGPAGARLPIAACSLSVGCFFVASRGGGLFRPPSKVSFCTNRYERATVGVRDRVGRAAKPSDLMAALVVLKEGAQIEEIGISRHGEYSLGRQADIATIVIDHPSTSRKHATLTVGVDGCRIQDEGSAHGTFLNGERLSPRVSSPISPGSSLKFGASSRTYVLRKPSVSPAEPAKRAFWASPREDCCLGPLGSVIAALAADPDPEHKRTNYQSHRPAKRLRLQV